jgi:uncharacterized membrane protein YgcG
MGIAARCRQLMAVWGASGEEITALCGADARDYLVVQRLILVALTITSVPGLFILLPIAIHLGTDSASGDENVFARTTVHHIPNQSPYLWAVVATSAVAVCAVETIADEMQQTLVRMRYARAELMASVAGTTVLLRRLPRCVTAAPRALEDALDARFPGRVHAVVVPRDGNEAKLRRKAAKARARLRAARRRAAREGILRRNGSGGGGSGGGIGGGRSVVGGGAAAAAVAATYARAVASAEDALAQFKRSGLPPPPPGCAFVVFKDPLTARRALTALTPTWHGAFVSCLRWMHLPFRAAWALGPGFRVDGGSPWGGGGGGRSGSGGGGGGGGGEIATGAAARRDAAAAAAAEAAEVSTSGRAATFDFGGRANAAAANADANAASAAAAVPAADDDNDDAGTSRLVTADSVFTPRPGLGGMPVATSLAVGAGVHWWRADHAPPPSGVLWDNVGVSATSRVIRLLLVNGAVSLGLIFVSSPLALFSFVNDVARTLNPTMDTWDEWVRWAQGHGGALHVESS